MSGKKSGACPRVSHDARWPRQFPGAPDEARTTPSPISGSRPISLGCAWCALCLGTHQPKLSTDERVRHDEAEQAIAPPRAENLVVPRIVAEEAQLGEHHPHQRSDREGRPRVADHDEQGPSSEEGEDRQGDLHPVVVWPAVEQSHRPYLPRQRTKAGRRGIDGYRQRVCG